VVIDPTKSSGKIQAAFLLEGISKRISRNHNGMPKIRLVFAILLVTKYFEVRTRYSSYNSVQAQSIKFTVRQKRDILEGSCVLHVHHDTLVA
jgi:hypothetical protein